MSRAKPFIELQVRTIAGEIRGSSYYCHKCNLELGTTIKEMLDHCIEFHTRKKPKRRSRRKENLLPIIHPGPRG